MGWGAVERTYKLTARSRHPTTGGQRYNEGRQNGSQGRVGGKRMHIGKKGEKEVLKCS